MPEALDPPGHLGGDTGDTRAAIAVAGAGEADRAMGAIGGRSPLQHRLLDAEELAQLQVLRGAVEPSAPIYAAILSVLVAAKERYQVEVRTEHLAAELSGAGHD